jgi:hypothetical protein
MFGALCVILGSVAVLRAAALADVSGAWNLSYTTSEGLKLTNTVTFKVEGDQITGTLSSPRGSVPVDEVKVDGENISFAVIRVGFGDKIRIDYKGKVAGDTMKLQMKVGDREPIDVVGKRGG